MMNLLLIFMMAYNVNMREINPLRDKVLFDSFGAFDTVREKIHSVHKDTSIHCINVR